MSQLDEKVDTEIESETKTTFDKELTKADTDQDFLDLIKDDKFKKFLTLLYYKNITGKKITTVRPSEVVIEGAGGAVALPIPNWALTALI